MENLEGLSTSKIQELRALQNMAKVHTDASKAAGGNLVLFDINPKKYQAQDAHHITSNEVDRDPANLGYLGTATTDAFPALQESFRDSVRGTERMDTMAKLIKGKNNVAIVTNHGDVTDIALALNIYAIELLQRNDPELIKKMKVALILSRIVPFFGIKAGASTSEEDDKSDDGQKVVAATDILQYLCNDQYFTLPRTDTIEKAMTRVSIKAHNTVTKGLITLALNRGGVLMGVAPSGTKDKQVILAPDGSVLRTLDKNETTPEGETKVYRMAPITSGTADILTNGRRGRRRAIYTALTSLWMKGVNPVAEMCDNVWFMENQEDVTAGMGVIGDRLGQRVPGHIFLQTPHNQEKPKKA